MKRISKSCAAIAAAVAGISGSAALAVVQDYNHARGGDGYQATHPGNGFYQATGTFDGRQFQPTPTGPAGAAGEFFFAGSDGGFVLDVRAPLGQGATWDQSVNLATGDNGGYMHMDFFQTGTAGYPPPLDGNGQPVPPPYNTLGNFWFGGAGNDAGPLPTDPNAPNYSQVLAYVDVLAPAGKKFEFRIESDYTFQGNGFKFVGTGTGGWQTIGGTLAQGIGFGSFDTFDPNLAMLVAFGTPGAGTNEFSWDSGDAFGSTPAVIRWDNLTLTSASSTWTATGGGNWASNSNWSTFAPSGRNATAVFGASASHQTVTLDTPTVPSNEDFPYQSAFYVGTLQLNSAAGYTIAGGEPLVIDTTAANGLDLSGPNGAINVTAGANVISAPLRLNRTTNVTVAAGSSLTVTGDQAAQAGAGLIKSGAGALEMKHVRGGSLNVNDGILKVTSNGGATGASNVGALTIGAAKLDLRDNKLITTTAVGSGTTGGGNYSAGSVSRMVQTGSNGGAWDGNGITTSMPDATAGLTSIGVALASDVRDFGLGTTLLFAGQTITPSSTLVMYTYAGDANLDGQITGDDYSGIDFTIQDPNNTGGWFNGDFNYDGFVSGDDYSAIDFNILAQGAPFSTGASISGLTAVPEPASLSVLGLGVTALVARRRRRRS